MATQKILTLLFAAFLLVATLNLVSAATFTQGTNSQLNISTGIMNPTTVTVASTITGTTLSNSLANNSINLYAAVDYTQLQAGRDYTTSVIVGNATANSSAIPVSIIKNFCTNGENASDIEIADIDANIDFDSWNPLDDVTLTVNVNNKNDSKQKIVVEASLYSLIDNTLVKIDGEDKKFTETYSIEDDSDHDFKFKFKISPKLEEGDYRLLVKAYKSSSETTKCTAKGSVLSATYYQAVRIDYDSKELLVDKIVGPTSLPCGQTDSISFDFYNLAYGDDETFRVKLFNKDLGLNVTSENFKLDNGKSQSFQLPLAVSSKALSVQYDVKIVLEYNYQESSETFSSSNTEYNYILKVDACKNEVKNASISAEFSTDTPKAIIGGQTVIEATIRNTGNVDSTYTVSTSDNNAWAKSTIDPSTITIAAGQSSKVKIYLDVLSNALEGNKEFTITATTAGLTVNQKVSIPLEKGLSTQGIVNHFKNNWYIYAIVLVNLILIIAIIIAVKSIVRKD